MKSIPFVAAGIVSMLVLSVAFRYNVDVRYSSAFCMQDSMGDIFGKCLNPECLFNCQRYRDYGGSCASCKCPDFQHQLIGLFVNEKIEWLPIESLKQSASGLH
jgi:hypothetical protein